LATGRFYCFREIVAAATGHPSRRPIEIRLRAPAADFPGTAREPAPPPPAIPAKPPPSFVPLLQRCNVPADCSGCDALSPSLQRDRRGEGGQSFRTGAQPPPPTADPSSVPSRVPIGPRRTALHRPFDQGRREGYFTRLAHAQQSGYTCARTLVKHTHTHTQPIDRIARPACRVRIPIYYYNYVPSAGGSRETRSKLKAERNGYKTRVKAPTIYIIIIMHTHKTIILHRNNIIGVISLQFAGRQYYSISIKYIALALTAGSVFSRYRICNT